MKRIIFSVIFLFAVHCSIFAATVTREEKFASISGVSVSDKFNVSIVNGPDIKAVLTVEDVLADFVHLSLIDGILSITYDQKSITKEIKAVLRQRDPKSIRMDVEISIPSTCAFNTVILSENAVLSSTAKLQAVNVFTVNVSGGSVIKNLSIHAKEAVINTSKRADVKISANADKISLVNVGNSVVEMYASSKEASIDSQGASVLNFSSSVQNICANASGSSKLTFKGSASNLVINGKNSSYIDASALVLNTTRINAASAYCDVNAKDTVYLNLSSGAKLYFSGAPVLEVVKVEKSSIYKKEPAK